MSIGPHCAQAQLGWQGAQRVASVYGKSSIPPHSSAPERGKRKAGGARGNVSFAESQPRNQQIEVRPSTGCLRALAVSLSFD
jgi:hypothetical protein